MVGQAKGRRLSVALLGLCALLGAGIAAEVVYAPSYKVPGAASSNGAAPVIAKPAGSAFSLEPLEGYAEVVERPLFWPTRRPPPKAENANAGAAKTQTSKVTLLGIVLYPDTRMALLKRPNSKQHVRVREGQQFDGWVMEAILPDRVVLRRGDKTEEIKLRDLPRKAVARKAQTRSKPQAGKTAKPSPAKAPAGQRAVAPATPRAQERPTGSDR